jgi:phage-related protein
MVFPGGVPPESITVPAGNAGTFETRPQITLTGPITGPQFVNGATGQAISFTGLALAASDLLSIDTDSRQCFLNGRFYDADAVSAWWVLQPGTTPVYVTGIGPGGAVLTVTWVSAWI